MNKSDFEIRMNKKDNKEFQFEPLFQREYVLSFNVLENGVIDGSHYSYNSSSLYRGKTSSLLLYAQYLVDKQIIK